MWISVFWCIYWMNEWLRCCVWKWKWTMMMRRFKMGELSIPKEAAYQIINDELMLDGNPRLNLASFVTTWMEPECDKLIMAAINKNYVDMDEYPVTTELQASTTPCYLLFINLNRLWLWMRDIIFFLIIYPVPLLESFSLASSGLHLLWLTSHLIVSL